MRPRPMLAVLAAVAATAFAAAPATASDYYVNRLTDSAGGDCTGDPGDCSLRAAILNANAHPGGDVVHLLTGTFALTIAGAPENDGLSGDLDVLETVEIVGRGPERTTIDAGGAAGIDERVFDVHAPGGLLTLRGVSVVGGRDEQGLGGGIRVVDGSLMLRTCWIGFNTNVGGFGGALHSMTLGAGESTTILDSWIFQNSALGSTVVAGKLWLINTTISANESTDATEAVVLYGDASFLYQSTIASNQGAGVRIYGQWTTIDSCTLSDNSGAELELVSGLPPTLRNTVIAGTCAGSEQPFTEGGNLESPGHSCGLGGDDFDDVADPGLSALALFGGPSPVLRPLASSAALDAAIADAHCATSDQRQSPRPRDGDGVGGATCDIGAVELQGPGEIFVDGFECAFLTAWSSAVL